MADIENLSKKILEDAETEAQSIKHAAESEALKITEKAKEHVSKLLAEAKILAESAYKESFDKKVSQNESLKRQEMLSKKMEIVESVMKKVREEIEKLPKEDYREYFKKNAKSLNIDEGEFQIGIKEKNIDPPFIKQLFKTAKLAESKEKPDFDYGIRIISLGALYTISLLSDLEYRRDAVLSLINREIFKEENN